MNEEIKYTNENSDPSQLNYHENPEFIKANFLSRLAAATIDHLICLIFFLLIVLSYFKGIMLQMFFSGIYFGGFFFIMTLILEIYYFTCEYYLNGQTPGKKLLNLQTKNIKNDLRVFDVFVRNFLRCSYLLPPFFFIPDAIFIILSKGRMRIGDLIAGTVVVKKFID